jgi:colanic acid/amylovoran biosynthesis glycosyltransferase
MRVALVVGQFPALSETFVLNQITGLLDRGVDVHIYAATRLPQRRVHADVERYRLLERTHYARGGDEGAFTSRLRLAWLLARAGARALGSRHRINRLSRSGRLDANQALPFSHLARGQARRYDIIHCHFGQYGKWGLALRNMGILEGALVTTFHGYDMSKMIRESGSGVYDRLFEEGDLFLPISDHWRRTLIGMGCPAERTVVHHMGVDGRNFPFQPRALPGAGERLRLLTVGRLVEKKGVEYAIRAVAEIAREHDLIDYEIVGSGPLQPELQRLIDDLGAARFIRMVGDLTQNEVAERMRCAHALLAPSVTARDGNQEGIPVVLMEAMATGLPPITTYHTGIPELVEHDVSGLLAPERDVGALAGHLRRLSTDSGLYRRLNQSARQRVEAEFDVDKLNDRLVRIFHGTAAGVYGDQAPTDATPLGRTA